MDETNGNKGSFFACYLLTSLNSRFKGCHYIGFTVNPRRRIRQHNGELTSGAWRTHRKRPWDMVLCVYGFESQVEALQFEWAWQHPLKSLVVKEAAARIPSSVRGLKKQFYLLFTMLNCDKWSVMDLNVQFLSSKYIDYRKGCPVLPPHMGLCIAPVDTLPTNAEEPDSELDDVEKERGSEPNFSDTEQDDPDPPTGNENSRKEDTGRRDTSENISEPLDVTGDPVASVSRASFISPPLGKAMNVSAQAKVTILGNTGEAVDFPAADDYTIRKAQMSDDELFPINFRQEQASSRIVQVGAFVSFDLDDISETSPSNCCRSKNILEHQSNSKAKSTSEISESGDVERRSISRRDDWLESLRELPPSSPSESGANEMLSRSPFSALLEQNPVKSPSSIVRRCLQKESNAYVPALSVSIRNLNSEQLPVNQPCTPPRRSQIRRVGIRLRWRLTMEKKLFKTQAVPNRVEASCYDSLAIAMPEVFLSSPIFRNCEHTKSTCALEGGVSRAKAEGRDGDRIAKCVNVGVSPTTFHSWDADAFKHNSSWECSHLRSSN